MIRLQPASQEVASAAVKSEPVVSLNCEILKVVVPMACAGSPR